MNKIKVYNKTASHLVAAALVLGVLTPLEASDVNKSGDHTESVIQYIQEKLPEATEAKLQSIAEAYEILSEDITYRDTTGFNTEDYKIVIKALSEIKGDAERQSIASACKTLTEGKNWKLLELKEIIERLSKIDGEAKRHSVVKAFKALSSGKVVELNSFKRIICILEKIEGNSNRESIASSCNTILQGKNWELWQYEMFIKRLSKFDEDTKRKSTLKAYKALFEDQDWGPWGFYEMFKIIDTIEEDDKLQSVVKAFKALSDGKVWEQEICRRIIEALGEIDSNSKRDSIVKTYKTLSKGKRWGGWACLGFINPLLDIESKSLNLFLKNISILSTKPVGFQHLQSILRSIPYIPRDDVEGFLKGIPESKEELDAGYGTYQKAITSYYVAMGLASEEHQNRLFRHWSGILNHENMERAEILVNFITTHLQDLGLYENHWLVQYALRIGTVIHSPEDSSNPYVVYGKLLENRKAPIDWEALPVIQGKAGGQFVNLNKRAIAEFVGNLEMDLGSIPELSAYDFTKMLNKFKQALAADEVLLTEAKPYS